MKHQSILCLTKALLVLAGLSACSSALAQSPKEKPKDCVEYHGELNYSAKISGPHLDRIKSIHLHFDRDNEHGQQTKLHTWLDIFGILPRLGDIPGLFRTTFNISPDVASGEYILTLIDINGDGNTQAVQGSALPNASFKVCAPEEFGPYKVDTVDKAH